MLLFSDSPSLPTLLLVAGMSGVMGGRFCIDRAAKAQLLQVAHAAFAPHELGDGDLDASPYRVDQRGE
jgi:hypothetical protein